LCLCVFVVKKIMLEKRDIALKKRMNLLNSFAEQAGRQGTHQLSKSLGVRFEPEESKAESITISEIASRFGFKDVMAASIFTRVHGDLPGTSLALIQRDHALRIIAEATGAKPERPVSLSAFTPQIVLKRIGENLSLTFYQGLAILTGCMAQPRLSAPEVLFDTWDNALHTMVQQFPTKTENLYIFWLRFCCIIGNERHPGVHLYFVDQELFKDL
jgi:hypothetical protein